MFFDRPKNINKAIEVRAINRPIKIVYFVPYEESKLTHWIIDAVFYESYTRWGGGRTLIIPTNNDGFLFKEYEDWLSFYDPDFIYTYVDLGQRCIDKIDKLSCPIAFLSYEINKIEADVTCWRDYLPQWTHYFRSISSLTTIYSPYVGYRHPGLKINDDKNIITQFHSIEEERFLSDNFGIAFDTHIYPNPIPGIFETYCFVPRGLPENIYAGSQRIFSLADILQEIASKKAITISMLAMAHSKSISRVEPFAWARNFNIFIGDSCLDRIHFWNARNFSPDYTDIPAALIVNKTLLGDADFVKQLGNFVNNHNFLGHQNGPRMVALRSYTHNKKELEEMRDIISKFTYNSIFLANPYNSPAMPCQKNYINYRRNGTKDIVTVKIREDTNKIQASEPEHFNFIPPRFKRVHQGQWVIDLIIERHNNLSRYSNVVDIWKLPYINKVTRAFTNNLAKVSRNNLLTVLPTHEDFPFNSTSFKNPYYYYLYLPEDETLFRWLLLDIFNLPSDDLRSSITYETYKDIGVSDKGQNLRGVISMFDSLTNSCEVLTNQFWRTVLRNNRNKIDGLFSANKLNSFLPSDKSTRERLQRELRFTNEKEVTKYLKANLNDTLEFLINKRVFYQVHQWRCSYCGHINIKTLDNIKNVNYCELCNLKYFTPIDLEWKYKLNDFVYRSLCERNGLTVLWAIGHLQNRDLTNSFYFLPEVDLFLEKDTKRNKHEIDILCVIDGKFYAVEVKLSAIGFTEKPDFIEKFIKKILLIGPDVALLVFEQYCESEHDISSSKDKLSKVVADISQKVGQHIKVETIIASDFPGFADYPIDIGYYGTRVNKILYK